MITKLTSLLLVAILTVSGAAATYSMNWWTVDSGGGSSSGSGYSLDGTIGQPDAGTLSGSGYSLDGGFWGGQATTTPPSWGGRLYLPAVLVRPCNASPVEKEPNNTLSEANRMCLSTTMAGEHDGTAGTGDLYYVQTHSTAGVHVTLNTDNTSGVQLLVYELDGDLLSQVAQDAVPPFDIVITPAKMQIYYVYVYSDASYGNTASYTLDVVNSAGGVLVDVPAPAGPVPTPPPIPQP